MVDKAFPVALTDTTYTSALKLLGDDASLPVNVPASMFARDADMTTALATKADATAMSTALGLKADATALTSGLATKADATATATSLATKADATTTTTALAGKADATATTTALANKAALTHVHSAADITSGLLSKARLAASGTAGQILRLATGGTNLEWADAGGALDSLTPGNDKILATDADGDVVAYSGIRPIALGIQGAPVSGDIWYSVPMPWAGIIVGARATIIGSSTPTITGTVKIGSTAVTGLTAVALAVANAGTRVSATAANTFAVGDILSFTHTASPGGAVTNAIVSLEVVQR